MAPCSSELTTGSAAPNRGQATAAPVGAGTQLVADIQPGPASSSPLEFEGVNGTAFFRAFGPEPGQELWKSTGVGATAVPQPVSGPNDLTDVGGTLFFEASRRRRPGAVEGDDRTGASGSAGPPAAAPKKRRSARRRRRRARPARRQEEEEVQEEAEEEVTPASGPNGKRRPRVRDRDRGGERLSRGGRRDRGGARALPGRDRSRSAQADRAQNPWQRAALREGIASRQIEPSGWGPAVGR